jgi:mRNA interferase HigB
MVIIAKATLKEFMARYPDSESALEQWYAVTKEANWKNYPELKKSFNSADAVGNDRYVFNIRGNAYRLIALIIFKVRTVFILFVGTHQEYDKIDAAKITFKK